MSNETKHTPGPWEVKVPGFGTSSSLWVAKVATYLDSEAVDSDDQQLANARLIAAAPELLEALRHILRQSCGPDWTHEQAFNFMRQTARAAIAKAEGRA